MDDQIASAIVGIITLLILIGFVAGAIKTFRRNWIAALLLLIFLFPIWVIWVFIELFTGDIAPPNNSSTPSRQSVNITVVNQADGRTAHITSEGFGSAARLDDFAAEDVERGRAVLLADQDDTKICPYCTETILPRPN